MEKAKLLNCLKRRHCGQQNAIKSPALEARFNISGNEVRDTVNALRRAGHPVCSDKSGYYYAETAQELAATIRQLSGRIAGIQGARDGLFLAYVQMRRINSISPLEIRGSLGGTAPIREADRERSKPAFSAENASAKGGDNNK